MTVSSPPVIGQPGSKRLLPLSELIRQLLIDYSIDLKCVDNWIYDYNSLLP